MTYYVFVSDRQIEAITSIVVSNPPLSILKELNYPAKELVIEPEPEYDPETECLDVRFREEEDRIVQYCIIIPSEPVILP